MMIRNTPVSIIAASIMIASLKCYAQETPESLSVLLESGGLLHVSDLRSRQLAEEFGQFKECLDGRRVSINEKADSAVPVFLTKIEPEDDLPCGHGNACYDWRSESILIDDDILNAPFLSRNVGTQWQSNSDDDSRVRHYRQFVFLHELGHKLLHHAKLKALDGVLHAEERQAIEDEADLFAVNCMVRFLENHPEDAVSTEAANEHRSRIRVPETNSSIEAAAIAIAETIVDANFSLTYADLVSPYEKSRDYRSFVTRAGAILTTVEKLKVSPNVAVFLRIARENLARLEIAEKNVVVEIRPEIIGVKIISLDFDRTGLLILGQDATLLRLPYSYLKQIEGGAVRPRRAVFETVCEGAAANELTSGARIASMDKEILLLPGRGLFSCKNKVWNSDTQWSSVSGTNWQSIEYDPTRDFQLLVRASNGDYEIRRKSGTFVSKPSSYFLETVTKAAGVENCEIGDVERGYSNGALTFRCRQNFDQYGICRMNRSNLELTNCQFLPKHDGVVRAFFGNNIFNMSDINEDMQFLAFFFKFRSGLLDQI